MSASRIHASSLPRAPLPSRAPAHVLNAVEEELVRRTAEGPLYHVTYNGRLPGIVDEYLSAGHARSIGSPAYDAHARGKVFLTEPDGVSFWMSRAEDFANHASDDPLEDGLVPVVLEVDPDCFWNDELVFDELGTRDASANAWMVAADNPFPAECLKVYTGKRWAPVEEYDEIDPASAFDEEPNPDFDGETDDKETLRYFKSKSPLEPEDL